MPTSVKEHCACVGVWPPARPGQQLQGHCATLSSTPLLKALAWASVVGSAGMVEDSPGHPPCGHPPGGQVAWSSSRRSGCRLTSSRPMEAGTTFLLGAWALALPMASTPVLVLAPPWPCCLLCLCSWLGPCPLALNVTVLVALSCCLSLSPGSHLAHRLTPDSYGPGCTALLLLMATRVGGKKCVVHGMAN